jgi:hypothetical protein
LFPTKQRRGARVGTTEAWSGEVERAGRALDVPEEIMRKTARSVSADEYIRRIDRMLIVTSVVIVALSVSLLVQMA